MSAHVAEDREAAQRWSGYRELTMHSGPVSSPRRVIHVDMDAFFVSVELLDHPELVGRPVLVGGSGPRGVVAAASYEARSYGVFSAMSSSTARRLCPHAVFIDGRHGRYAEVSAEVMSIFGRCTPLVEPLSLDEAFLDVTGSERAFGSAREIAARIRSEVLGELGLTCSVGVAPNKFLAKLATGTAKPTATPTGPAFGLGIAVVPPGGELDFLWPLPVSSVWGVGPRTLERLVRLGVSTIGDLAAIPLAALTASVGNASGRHLHELSWGRDDRPVVAGAAPKSVSHEETFAHDRHDTDELRTELARMADAVSARLRAANLAGRTVSIKVRFASFETISRSITGADPMDDATELLAAATGLLDSIDVSHGVRLIGLAAGNLVDGSIRQLRLLAPDAPDGGAPVDRTRVNSTIDEIRDRFGAGSIGSARLVDGSGLRRFTHGQQQWGPTAPTPASGTTDRERGAVDGDR